MIRYFKKISLIVLPVIVMGYSVSANADDPDKTPTAEAVLQKFTEACGGAAKFKSIKSMKMSGKLEIVGAGITGTIDVVQLVPNKVSTKAEMAQVGSQSQGSNGEIAWEVSTMMGPRLLKDTEMKRLMDQADFTRYFDPAEFYKDMKVLGVEDVEGEKCYKLKLTHKGGYDSTEYYSVATGLQTASEMTMESPMGAMEIKSYVRKYLEVDGLKFPGSVEAKFPNGMSQKVDFEKIEINPEVNESAFEIPNEVKGLVEETEK